MLVFAFMENILRKIVIYSFLIPLFIKWPSSIADEFEPKRIWNQKEVNSDTICI